MPTREETAYFGAGPCPLPTSVIEASASAFVNFENSGIGLAEVSHRSNTANQILADAKKALTHLYDIPTEGDDGYEILFMQGGGTGEFSATVQNVVGWWCERRRRRAIAELGEGKDAEVLQRVRQEIKNELKLDYLVTGSWSKLASQEAVRLLGTKYVNVAADGRKLDPDGKKFVKIPDESKWNLTKGPGCALAYFCDNETVDGVEFQAFPEVLKGGPEDRVVVADMSSNFLSRKLNVKDYGVIFGGAQKNMGIAGITVIIVKKSLLALTPAPTFMHQLADLIPNGVPPVMFDFYTIAKNNSLYNTLPIFNLYVAMLVLQALENTFGEKKVAGQEAIVDKKASLIYSTLDAYPDVYQVLPDKSIRSRMNICFRIKDKASNEAGKWDEAREKEFLSGAEKRNLMGLKGHRSLGGMRASNYNAVTEEHVEKLVAYMQDFAKS